MEKYLKNTIERFATFWWGEKGLTTLLAMLMLGFIIEPLIATDSARIAVGILLSCVLISGIGNVSKKLIPRIFASLVTLTAITLTWLLEYVPDRTMAIFATLSQLACMILLTAVTLSYVFQAGPVTAHRVRGAVAAYILIGLSWAFIYQCIDLTLPGAFSSAYHPGVCGRPRAEPESHLLQFRYVDHARLRRHRSGTS